MAGLQLEQPTVTPPCLLCRGAGQPAPQTTAAITRLTYFFGAQAVAQRITGDPVNVNNGLFYRYSDHLGSTSVLGKAGASSPQNDSIARYFPFGDWRVEPAQTITSLGYTGHRHNNQAATNDLGLIYMNARYYLPHLGRFLSPDTLVPDPTDSQSYNRYTYVFNNPVRLTDPDGHRPSDGCYYGECGTTLSDSVPDPLPSGSNGLDVTIWLVREMNQNSQGEVVDGVREMNSVIVGFDAVEMKATAYLTFMDMVDYGRPWDFKKLFIESQIRFVTIGGYLMAMDVVANIHYGFVGAAAGFSYGELHFGAGVAQLVSGDRQSAQLRCLGDACADYHAIDLGIELFRTSEGSLTIARFESRLAAYVRRGYFDNYIVIP